MGIDSEKVVVRIIRGITKAWDEAGDILQGFMPSPLDHIASAAQVGGLARMDSGVWLARGRVFDGQTPLQLVTILMRVERGPSKAGTHVFEGITKQFAPADAVCLIQPQAFEIIEADRMPQLLSILHSNQRRAFTGIPGRRFRAVLLQFTLTRA